MHAPIQCSKKPCCIEETENMCGGNSRLRLVFPQIHSISRSPKLPLVFLQIDSNTENMFSISFRKHQDEKEGNDMFSCRLSKCKFSLLAPSLRQQLELVLCLHRVIETRFLTNQRGFFLGLFSDHRVIYRFRPA